MQLMMLSMIIVRAENQQLGSVQKNETVLY